MIQLRREIEILSEYIIRNAVVDPFIVSVKPK